METSLTILHLDIPVFPNQLPALRGAVVEKALAHKPVFEAAGISTDVFHNHDEQRWDHQEDQTYRRYPLVQYKTKHRKAELLGLGEGARALQLWLPLANSGFKMQGRTVKPQLTAHARLHEPWQLGLMPTDQHYRLNKWLPFNATNYARWRNTPRLADRAQLLDASLWGHVFQLADALNAPLPRDQVNLYVATIDMQTYKTCYGRRKLALDITFCTNLDLPAEIGLGQGTSIGFGKVQPIQGNAYKPM